MEQQQDLLLEIEQEVYLERVSAGVRFVNWLLDGVALWLINRVINIITGLFSAELLPNLYAGRSLWEFLFIGYLFGLAINFLYYTVLEGSTKGRTLGKLVTGCRVVMNDGTPISMQTAALRSLCRLIPFEPFSAFTGNPWHDSITRTQVVKVRR